MLNLFSKDSFNINIYLVICSNVRQDFFGSFARRQRARHDSFHFFELAKKNKVDYTKKERAAASNPETAKPVTSFMIIGIGGVSRSGKTTRALELKTTYEQQGKTVAVLHQDDFTQPKRLIPRIRYKIDWEHPGSMDFRRFEKEILAAQEKFDIVIAEGILVFYDPAVNALFDERILMEIDRDTFMERRAKEIRWGREPRWYLEYVWESYLRWGKL